ncbi:hypothetical protein [Ruminobacter sp.]|jgi:hypothetical protein
MIVVSAESNYIPYLDVALYLGAEYTGIRDRNGKKENKQYGKKRSDESH